MEDRREWRFFDGEWHYTQHFPNAFKYRSVCDKSKAYGLYDAISIDLPVIGDVCEECARKSNLGSSAFCGRGES